MKGSVVGQPLAGALEKAFPNDIWIQEVGGKFSRVRASNSLDPDIVGECLLKSPSKRLSDNASLHGLLELDFIPIPRGINSSPSLKTYHVPCLGASTGEDEDSLGAVARVSLLEVIAGDAELARFDGHGLLNGNGRSQGREGRESEGELHGSVCGAGGLDKE